MVDKASTISSDMSDVASWTGWNGARHSIVSGQLNIAPPASTSAYYPVTHPTTVDLTGSFLSIECVQTLATTSGCETVLELILDSGNKLSFIRSTTLLLFRKRIASVNTNVASVTYSNSTHRFWRIREQGGTIYWDTSPGGSPNNYTNQATLANPFAINSLTVDISAGVFNTSVPSPGTAIFDNLNLPHPRSFFAAS